MAVVVPYYAHAAATIKLDTELQIRSESDELALEKTSLDYNSTTGFYDTDNSKYVTIYNKDLDDYSLFWCWDDSASGASDYFDYKKCSPYSVGIIIPSGQDVSTITLKLYKQATDFNWIRISYDTNGGTHDTKYNNYYTWPRFCTNQATCTIPNPDGVFVRSGYIFDGWDASALHSTLTGAGAIAAGGTLGGQYITVKKDVTIKATWELTDTKANVTIDMNGSVSNKPRLPGDCTSDSCYTPYDAPTRYGYNFIGWMVSVNGVVTDVSADHNLAGIYENIASVIPSKEDNQNLTSVDVVLTAQWDPKDVLISYACSTDGEGELSYTLKFDENFTVISKADSNRLCPKDNYDIVYWQYNDDRYDLGATYNIDSLGYQLLPVYVYTPKTYKITYDCGDGGTLLAGYNNIYDVVFKESYATAGRICQKDGYVQTGWQTPNAATGGSYEYELDTEQNSYGFYSDRTFTAIYTPIKSYTITYDCGDGELVVTDDETQTVNTLEKYTVKPKICDYPGFIHNGWKDSNGNTLNFYTEYEYNYNDDINLTATYRNDPDVPCYITFTSQYDVTNMPADMELQTGSTPTDPVQVPMLTSGFDKRFDGWSYYDSEHNMYFKYFDLNGNPVRSLDYDHCDGGMELQAQWVEKNNCSNKTIYEHSDGQTPVRDVYYSLVFSDTLEDYATDGEIYSDAQCENPISITESDLANIIPANSTYNGIYGHYNVANAGSTTDIACIRTDGDFANVEYCRKEYDTTNEEDMIWYVKYTCNDGYKEFNKQCVRATKVYFNGNAGDGAAASGGATYSEQIMYYGQPLPEISRDTTPTLAGYKFMGWYDGPDYATSTQYYNANEQPVAGTWNKNTDTATLYAGWQPVVYTVIYDCGAGTLNGDNADTATWQREFIVAGPGRCSLANHVLTGWDAMEENTTNVLGTHPVSARIPAWSYGTNMKFVAKYATQTEITFDNNGGDGGEMGLTPDPVIATYGLALPEISPNNPTREGYTFTGWYDKNRKKYYNVDATPAVDDWDKTDAQVTLYAGWAGETYTVTFDCGYGTLTGDESDTATLGMPFTMPAPDRCLYNGWTLYAWESQLPDGTRYEYGASETITNWTYVGNITFTAMYNPGQIIIFNPNSGTLGGQVQPVPTAYGEALPGIHHMPPTRTGYTFMGWYSGTDYKNSVPYYNANGVAVKDKWDRTEDSYTLYAGWEPKVYKAIYVCAPGTNNGTETEDVTFDTNYKLAGANRCSYAGHVTSGGWDARISANNPTILKTYGFGDTISPWNYDSDIEFVAKYTPQTTIYFDANGETGTTPDTITATYGMKLPEISSNNPTRTGHQFMGWYDGPDYATSTQYYDASGKPTVPTWEKTDANVTLYAGWKARQVTITFEYHNDTSERTYSIDKSVKLPTFTELGWTTNQYSNWYGWKLTAGVESLDVLESDTVEDGFINDAYIQNQNIIARPLFEDIWHTILYFFESADDTTPEQLGTHCTSKACVLPMNSNYTKTGHVFSGWDVKGNGELDGTFDSNEDLAEYIAKYSPETLNIYVNWVPETYRLSYSCGNNTPSNISADTVTFGDTYTLPNDGGCTATGSKQKGWVINNVIYDLGNEFVWDIDLGTPGTQYTIMPAWEDFWETTLVAYMDDNSSTNKTLDAVCNSKTCILPENIYAANEKLGYTFNGWSVDGIDEIVSAGYDIAQYINADTPKSLKIVAQWKPNEYTLTYHCGDGNGTPPAPQPITYNTLFAFAQNTCTKDGYNFAGWGIESEIGHPGQNAGWQYTSDMTAVARWEQNTKFVVTLNPNGGSGGTQSVNVTYNEIMPNISDLPTRQYYEFQGFVDEDGVYYYNAAGTAIKQWPVLDNGVLTAVWEPYTFTATYNCGEGSNPPSPQSARYEEEFTPAENTCTRTGYTFAGWAVDGQSVPNSFKWTFTKPVTFTAQWTANGNYTVTLNPDNGDTRYYQLSNVVYNKQMSDIPNIPTRTGYTFDGYYYGNTQYFDKDGHCVKAYDIDKDVTMFAHWTPKEYAVRYQCGNDATSSTLPQPFVKYDQEYELLSGICNKEGYVFVGWKADNAGDMLSAGVPFTWTYDKNTTFVAQYTQNVYKVYLQYDGNGANNNYTPSLQTCTSDAECLLLPADTFTRRGYRFTGWIVGLTSTGVPFNPQDDIKQYITSARDGKTISVRARWTAVPYNVTYDANGGVSTLPKTECTIESCTPVSVGNIGTYMTRPGYVFKHWTTDLKIGNPANLSNGISQDTTLYAMWDACPIGYYKPDDVAADAQCLSCEKLSDPSTRTEYNATSNLASTSRTDCAATCTPFNLQGGRATPVKDTVQYPEKCEYTAISDKGNPCTIVDNKCVEKSCGMGYELVNNECTLCPDDNAATYYQSNSCDIKACKPGYHVNPSDIRQCAEDVIECYDIPNATYATKTWNTQAYSYEKCTAVECDTDYHIEDSVCAPDTRECDIENGTGWQEWLYKSKTWSECYAEQCNPGYESDGNGCVRCDNAYDEYGDLAASTYIKGCEIATCMYQGEKYILANNQCVLVCYNDQDNTGAMWWDSNTKKCRRECSPGYSHWDQ